MSTVYEGGVYKFFLIGQNRSTNQRSGIILEVQIQISANTCLSKFSFSKNSRGLNISFFCENWHEASFYIKKTPQKYGTNLKFDF